MHRWLLFPCFILLTLAFPSRNAAQSLDAPTEMRPLPGGSFIMGTTPDEIQRAVDECLGRDGATCQAESEADSQPQALVTVAPFMMEIREVTLAQYAAFLNRMGAGSHRSGCSGQVCALTTQESDEALIELRDGVYNVVESEFNAGTSVMHVTWYGAQTYCQSLGRRLPSEAEWEYAARAGDDRSFPWGNFWDGPSFVNQQALHPFGLDALAGGSAEWVADWYARDALAQRNAGSIGTEGPADGVTRVVRGSWEPPIPFYFRTSQRKSELPGGSAAWIGFRCAANA